MTKIPETERQFLERLAERVRRLGDPQEFVDILVEYLRVMGWSIDMGEAQNLVRWIAEEVEASYPKNEWYENHWPYEFEDESPI